MLTASVVTLGFLPGGCSGGLVATGETPPGNGGAGGTAVVGPGGAAGSPMTCNACDPGVPCVAGVCGRALARGSMSDHMCVRRADESVWCWGRNEFGELGDGTFGAPHATPTKVAALGAPVVSLAVGDRHTCATLKDHSVVCWGDATGGRLGDGTSAGPGCSKNCNPNPVQAVGLPPMVEVGASGYAPDGTSCARSATGEVWCWGTNGKGQVGDGSTTPRAAGVKVPLASPAAELAVGANHACVRLETGAIQCWGDNEGGEIGAGDFATSLSPRPVVGLPSAPAVSVATGLGHTCAALADGSVWCWGVGAQGQLGPSATSDKYYPHPVLAISAGEPRALDVVAGDDYSCALKSDGSVWCWGSDEFGELGIDHLGDTNCAALSGYCVSSPTKIPVLSSIVELTGRRPGPCARAVDGRVWCWGGRIYGQIGDGQLAGVQPTPDLVIGIP